MMAWLRSAVGVGLGLALGLAMACGDDSDGSGNDTEAPTCEHGTFSPCVCTDGSMGTQMCAHDTSGFEACMCDGDETDEPPPGTTDDGSTAPDDGTSTGPSGNDSSGTASTTGDGTESGASEGPVGSPPTAQISHPGDGEMRQVDVPIPYIGMASDPEDGALSGGSMVWTSDVEGMLGEGETFDATPTVLGPQVITLEVTDSDGNVASDSITIEIVP